MFLEISAYYLVTFIAYNFHSFFIHHLLLRLRWQRPAPELPVRPIR